MKSNNSNDLPEVIEGQAPPMTVDNLLAHVQLVKEVMDRVMKQDKHYGVIPGTDKPTLLKPGAELLCLTFRLGPKYEIINRSLSPIGYEIRCSLHSISTGRLVAEGMGSCNQHEVKYRYRSENTGQEVPGNYWKDRDPQKLGIPHGIPRKKDGKWWIYAQVENKDPHDLDNTILKMACKRALVAATLNAVAASEIFTQDVEDFVNGTDESVENKTKQKQKDLTDELKGSKGGETSATPQPQNSKSPPADPGPNGQAFNDLQEKIKGEWVDLDDLHAWWKQQEKAMQKLRPQQQRILLGVYDRRCNELRGE